MQIPWRGCSENSDDDAHLETVKDSNEDYIKVNQMMSYIECGLSYCVLTQDKKKLVRIRIFIGINIQPYVYEKTELLPK